MKFTFTTSGHKRNVEHGFNVLFQTMHTNDKFVSKARDIIGQSLNDLAQVQDTYENNLKKNDGWWKNRGYQSEYEDKAREIFTKAIDDLSELPTSGGVPRTLQQLEDINDLRTSLPALVGKENVQFAQNVFTENLSTQLYNVQVRKEKARENWGRIGDNLSKIAQLAPDPSRYEIPIDIGTYGPEVDPLAPEGSKHYAVPLGGAGLEPLIAIKTMLETGKVPEMYKGLRSGKEGVSLYQVMEEGLRESKGNRQELHQIMEREFTASPDVPQVWIQKSFTGVTYLNPEERSEYEVRVQDGKLVHPDGKPVDTSDMRGKNSGGKAAFVIVNSPTGPRMMLGEHVGGEFHHSSFKSGERVIAAGMIGVKDGQITELNNTSGHYKPLEHNIVAGLKAMPELEEAFHPKGVIKIDHSPSQEKPENFHDFMERAEPLAVEKWQELQHQQREYYKKLQVDNPKDHIRSYDVEDLIIEESPKIHKEKEKEREPRLHVGLGLEPLHSGKSEIPPPPVQKGSSISSEEDRIILLEVSEKLKDSGVKEVSSSSKKVDAPLQTPVDLEKQKSNSISINS